MESDRSEVKHFYDDTCIFITGGTGFLGKLLIEKLLRATTVAKIYVLVRNKKGKNGAERVKEIFKHEIFNSLKEGKDNFMNRIDLIIGDCILPDLGIGESDWILLKANVNVVFHCAATVRFDQQIRTAAYINIRATMDIIKHAKEMKKLKAFVHVSTAYSNCPRKDIDEVFYEPTLSSKEMFKLLDDLTDEQLDACTPRLIGKFPNTYSFTKCIAEDVVRTDAVGLPIAVLRPSVVTSTYKEPFPGWVDNLYGSNGVFFGVALGVLRTLYGNPETLAETVPVDYVINMLITMAWKASQKKRDDDNDADIYNYVSSPEAPIDWNRCTALGFKHVSEVPFSNMVWYPIFNMTKHRWFYNIRIIFMHLIPAYMADFICLIFRKKPRMVPVYKKIHKFISAIEYFTQREWNFLNQNTKELWKGLNEKDKEMFPFSMKNLDWDEYYKTYLLGARLYILKDPIETIPTAKRKYFILKCVHYALVFVLWSCLLWFLNKCWNTVLN